jgi:protein-tyrosine phosphatase
MTGSRQIDEATRRLLVLELRTTSETSAADSTDGGRTRRWNVLYRNDGLSQSTPRDHDILRPLGLRTLIDLHRSGELAEREQLAADTFEMDFVHLPILDVLWPNDSTHFAGDREFLLWAYRDMLDVGAHHFAAAVRRLAQPGALPPVFHCAAGKSRTRLLAALLPSAIGARREHVLADHALTAAGIERILAWAQNASPGVTQRLAATPSWHFAALPDALDQILDGLCESHGMIHDYLLSLGVTREVLDHIVDALLDVTS